MLDGLMKSVERAVISGCDSEACGSSGYVSSPQQAQHAIAKFNFKCDAPPGYLLEHRDLFNCLTVECAL